MSSANARSMLRKMDEIPSPCVSICAVDPDGGYCLGCYRTLDEIADWISLDSAQRLAVWDAIGQRRKAADATDSHR
ncbi:MAG: DUF1289 domain-containing protein [Casimicrobiaceae bacterium]